jgi:hypothetical protein
VLPAACAWVMASLTSLIHPSPWVSMILDRKGFSLG